MRTRRGYSILLAAAVGVTSALLATTPTSPAAAAPGELRVLQWNIAGVTFQLFQDETKPDNEGTLEVVRRLVGAAGDRHPHLVSMNETCWLQAKYAQQQLAGKFGSAAVQFVDSAGTDPLCGIDLGNGSTFQSGSALIAVGADATWERRTYYFTDDALITSTQTERAAACMLVSFESTLGQVVRACTLHLDKNHEKARQQAETFANFMAEGDDPYPLVLAGDFNSMPDLLQPGLYAPEQGGGGNFIEVDYPESAKTFYSGNKYDYVFGDRDHFRPQGSGEVIPPGNCPTWPFDHPCSDHFMLFGTLTFRDDVPVHPSPGTDPDPGETPPADMAPFVSAGPDVSGNEGAAIALRGAADDDHGAPDLTWSFTATDGVDAGASCTFTDAHSARTSITCTDDGTYTARLRATDGVNDPVSASTTVTVSNVAPTLNLSGPAPWQVFRARTGVSVTAPFTDPGTNDTHTCTVDWDDASTDTYASSNGSCTRGHTFANAGMYTMKVKVTDDDGGSDTASVMVVVYDPEAGFTNADGSLLSPPGSFAGAPSAGGQEWFHLAGHYYHPTDTVPVGTAKTWLTGTGLRLDAGSQGLQWMVVTPDGKVAARGKGTLQGESGEYGFVFYGYDGCGSGPISGCQPGGDRFRVVVWPLAASANPGATITYDNRAQAGYDVDVSEPQNLESGIVTIHPPS